MLTRLSLVLLLCSACPESSSPVVDSGPTLDSSGTEDTAVQDTSPGVDTGPTPDSGPEADAGPIGDTGPRVDVGGSDGGQPDTGLALCSSEEPCGGACEGDSCDGDWFCNLDVDCTDDIAAYCSCDGVTFRGSSTCPPQPFAHRGECRADGANCDLRSLACRQAPPRCSEGEVPEMNPEGSCYTGVCVAITECGCTVSEQCSNGGRYVCRNDTHRCTPSL